MALELYIEDELIDLIGDEQISTDYAIAEIGDFATRKGFRSINFDIPITANNKRILENAEIVNNTTTRPYRRLKARVFVDGIDQNIRFADIESAQETYNVRLYGGNASFFEEIKGLLVSQLDMSDLDHYINLTNIINSRTNTEGYIYPLIDYHDDSPNVRISDSSNVFRVNYTFPSVFEETIIERCVAQLGYTLNNSLLNNLDYQATEKILPCVTPQRNTDFSKYLQKFEKLLTPPFNEVPSGVTELPAGTFQVITPQSNFYLTGSLDIFEFADAVEYTATYEIVINNAGSASTISFYTLDTLDNTNTPILNLIFTDNVAVGNNTYSGTFTRQALTSPNGATSSLLFVDNSNPDLTYVSAELEIISGTVLSANKIVFGSPYKQDYVTVNSLFDKLKVADLLKAYLQKYSALITVNEDTKEVFINSFNDIQDNIPLAVDWSDKIDYTDNNLVEYSLDEYAQSNELVYKDDNNIEKPFGTDGVILVDDETLEPSSDFIESIYCATEMVVRLDGLLLPQIGIFETTDDSPPITEIKNKQPLRTLYLEKVSGDVDYTDGSSTTNVTTSIPLAWFIRLDKDYNLGFGNNLIELYYSGLQDVLNRTKIVTEQIRLNALDIQQLDFLKPVYLAKHNAYFYISKISGFTYGTNESTEVELVKLR